MSEYKHLNIGILGVALFLLVVAILSLTAAILISTAYTRPAAAPTPQLPTIRAGALLTTLPGIESRVEPDSAAIVCRPPAGTRASIRRRQSLADHTLYYDVKVDEDCYGWIDAAHLDIAH